VKLADNARLDALCGEYLVGTLRGAARRRFERALREEPRVALRLSRWQEYSPRYSKMIEARPSAGVWRRLERELGLARYRVPWYSRAGFWRGWALAATAALVVAIGLDVQRPPEVSALLPIARLAGKAEVAQVTAMLSRDGRTLELRAARPVVAGPAQSYELWLLEGKAAPISIAVLGSLDARFAVPPALVGRLAAGAKLAVSVEPAGGSPTGAPTGPVILVGDITA